MLENQAFVALFTYYLSLLKKGAVLEARYSTQTFPERWVWDTDNAKVCLWESDIRKITRRLDPERFFVHMFRRNAELREVIVKGQSLAA